MHFIRLLPIHLMLFGATKRAEQNIWAQEMMMPQIPHVDEGLSTQFAGQEI